MFRPVPLFIGLRYVRAKRRNHFISFISLSSVIGIALGVMVLITVLSVMNGFDSEIRQQVFGIVQHVSVSSTQGNLHDWQEMQNQLEKHSHVQASAPFIQAQGLLIANGLVKASFIAGIDPQEEKRVSAIAEKFIAGRLEQLKPGEFGIIIGDELANQLGLDVGDKVTVIVPQIDVSIAGVEPRSKRFTVVGIFRIGGGFRFDNALAFIHLNDAQKLLLMSQSVSGIRLKVDDLFAAPRIAAQISSQMPSNIVVGNWTNQFGAFFQAIKLEKNMMFLILLLIIAVAAFNLVSSLVMVVTDKRADIAILRTIGATPGTILRIFLIQGSFLGFLGTAVGVAGGVLLALNVTPVVNFIQDLFQIRLISADIYFIDYLPSQLQWHDVMRVGGSAFLMSLIATLYPAWRAANIDPVEALRYE